MKPATLKARALLAKLEALAERGINGERDEREPAVKCKHCGKTLHSDEEAWAHLKVGNSQTWNNLPPHQPPTSRLETDGRAASEGVAAGEARTSNKSLDE